jgi:hypothetical protein
MKLGRRRGWTALVLLGCVLVMGWLGSEDDGFPPPYRFTSRISDYYDQIASGFLDGHLYLKINPDVGHPDASFYRGHYYLYYGVVPAVVAFLPYRWLTGCDLSTHLAIFLFTAAGFLLAAATFRAERRRQHLPRAPLFEFGAIVLLAFGTATPMLLTRGIFYEVPVAAGYACAMAWIFVLHRAWFGPSDPARSLAAAGLMIGLAVGCRPNYVLGVPILAIAAWGIARQRAVRPRDALGAALLPAALVGAGLAAYNFERFGNIFEFGFNYGQNQFFANHHRLLNLGFLWQNLKWYYLTPPWLTPFFPYVRPEAATFAPAGYGNAEAIHGQFAFAVLAIFAVLSVIAPRARPLRPLAGFAAWPAALGLACLAFVTLLTIRGNRYVVDFQAPLAAAVVLATAGIPATLARRGARIWSAGFAALAVAVAGFNLLAGLQQFEEFGNSHPRTWEALARLGDRPAGWAERLGWLRYGPIELQVVFPPAPTPGIRPLLVLGSPERDDGLYVAQLDNGQIELVVEHHGYGGLSTRPLTVIPGRAYDLTVRMGAFYPPLTDAYFNTFDPTAARLRKTLVEIQWDREVVLQGLMPSYDDAPGSLEFGRNDITFNGNETRFDGRIVSWRRLAPEGPPPPPVAPTGCWRLRLTLPPPKGAGYPVLAWGVTGAGNLLYLSAGDNGRFRLGFDQWGGGGALSPDLEGRTGAEHLLEVYAGPPASRHAWPAGARIPPGRLAASSRVLRVWLDGRPAWTTPVQCNLESFGATQIGSNPQGFSTALGLYGGIIREEPYTLDEAANFVRINLAPPP